MTIESLLEVSLAHSTSTWLSVCLLAVSLTAPDGRSRAQAPDLSLACRAQLGNPSAYNPMTSLVNMRYKNEYIDLLSRLKVVSARYNTSIAGMREHEMVKLPKKMQGVKELKSSLKRATHALRDSDAALPSAADLMNLQVKIPRVREEGIAP